MLDFYNRDLMGKLIKYQELKVFYFNVKTVVIAEILKSQIKRKTLRASLHREKKFNNGYTILYIWIEFTPIHYLTINPLTTYI